MEDLVKKTGELAEKLYREEDWGWYEINRNHAPTIALYMAASEVADDASDQECLDFLGFEEFRADEIRPDDMKQFRELVPVILRLKSNVPTPA